jgi:hypothetical protein
MPYSRVNSYPSPMTTLDLLAAVVRGDATQWPANQDASGFVAAAIDHSVESLAVWQLRRAETFDSWPDTVKTALERIVREEVLLEIGREGELRRLLTALHEAGVACLLTKGAALAYSHFPEPWLRPRNDNDLLIGAGDRLTAGRVLTNLGYAPATTLEGDIVGHQLPFVKTDRLGFRHVVDLHWKVNNRPLLADTQPFEELWASSIALPRLGEAARTPDDVQALLLACLHRVTHHRNSDNLVWCYDIHLLATQLDADDWNRFVALARGKRVAAIAASSLQCTIEYLQTRIPPAAIAQLAVTGEPSEMYLSAGAWHGDVRLADFKSLPGWRAKLRLIREVALPNSDYMLKTYDASSRMLVPALHLHRLARGTWRLLRRFAQ